MSEDACLSFRAALAARLSGSGPADFPIESARHLNACEACQGQVDELETPDDESDGDMLAKMMPILEALAKVDEESEPRSALIDLAMARAKERDDIDTTVSGFISRHPALEPAKHGIDTDRYEYGAFFNALSALNLLMNRLCRHGDPLPKSYGLREDGTIFLDGAVRVPAESVRREIGRFIVGERKVRPEEMTDDLAEAFRREAAWSDDETCAKLAGWIVAAVRHKADLMRNYRMVGVDASDPRVITLEPIRTPGPSDRDPIELWK